MLAAGGLARPGDIKGTVQMLPWGRSCWDLIRSAADSRLRRLGMRRVRPEGPEAPGATLLSVPYVSPEVAAVPLGAARPASRPVGRAALRRRLAEAVAASPKKEAGLWRWSGDIVVEAMPTAVVRTGGLMWMDGLWRAADAASAQRAAQRVHSEVMVALVESTGASACVTASGWGPGGGSVRALVADGCGSLTVVSRCWWCTVPEEPDDGVMRHLAGWSLDGSLLRGLLSDHRHGPGTVLAPAVSPVSAALAGADADEMGRLAKAGLRAAVLDAGHMRWQGSAVDPAAAGVPVRLDAGSGPLRAQLRVPGSKEQCLPVDSARSVADAVSAAAAESHRRMLSASRGRLGERAVDMSPGPDARRQRAAAGAAAAGALVRVPWEDLALISPEVIRRSGACVLGAQAADGTMATADTSPADLVGMLAVVRE